MMQQMALFPELKSPISKKIVNVASIPQRSVFRYPGGKTWFVPQLRQWFASHLEKPDILLEPFAGGGIVGLTVAFEHLAEKIILVEKDPEVAAVWHTILGSDAQWLITKILEFNLNSNSVHEELQKTVKSTKHKAFQTILKNRTYHGGILAAGSGLLKNGENGKGLLSRWYPVTLARRISELSQGHAASRISFIEGDAFESIKQYQDNPKCWMFIDPPYTAGGKQSGKRLYNHHQVDHHQLFDMCAKNKGLFLMTYDNTTEIKNLAFKNGFSYHEICMKNKHHSRMTELIIGHKTDALFLPH